MWPGSNFNEPRTAWAGILPTRSISWGRKDGVWGVRCMTTKIEAGKSAGRPLKISRRATTPPAEVPITTISCPCMGALLRVSPDGSEMLWGTLLASVSFAVGDVGHRHEDHIVVVVVGLEPPGVHQQGPAAD